MNRGGAFPRTAAGRGAQESEPPGDRIIVVSGLPRSGTSMMMQMLEAAGLLLCSDGRRRADTDNPRGYFEYEPVSRLRDDATWVARVRGQVLKVVSPLLFHLPPQITYRIIFLQRDMEEILASQQALLARRATAAPDAVDDDMLARRFREHLRQVEEWMALQKTMRVRHVRHDALLDDPVLQAGRVASFLEIDADIARMAAVVDPGLYRQRRRGGRGEQRP